MILEGQAKPISTSKPADARSADCVAEAGGPYRLTCGKTAVELSFAEPDAPSLESILLDYFIRKQAHHCGD